MYIRNQQLVIIKIIKNTPVTMDKPQKVEDIRRGKAEGREGVGKRWTEEEENRMLEEIKTMDVEEVAKLHKRMSGGISARLCLVAARMLKEGKSIEEVMLATKQTKDDIEQFIKKNGDKIKTAPSEKDLGDQSNFKNKWTEEEEKLLLEQVKTMKIDEIAKLHGRGIGSIVLRLSKIGAEMVESGKTMDEAMLITKQSKQDIEKATR